MFNLISYLLLIFRLKGHRQFRVSERPLPLPGEASSWSRIPACLPLQLGTGRDSCKCWRSLVLSQQDPTESQNLANQHPELVKELLAEAEIVLKNAPMQVGGEDCWRMGWFLVRTQVRGDMVDAGGPMGPDQQTWGGWWSVLLTLGSDHPRVREPPTRRMISILTISIRSFLLGLIWTTTSTTSNSTMSDYLPRRARIQLWSHWRQVEVVVFKSWLVSCVISPLNSLSGLLCMHFDSSSFAFQDGEDVALNRSKKSTRSLKSNTSCSFAFARYLFCQKYTLYTLLTHTSHHTKVKK